MAKRVWLFFTVLTLAAGTAAAQDALSVLRTASVALGGSNLKTIQFTANGRMNIVGQSYSPDSDWPATRLNSYTRTIDYEAGTSQEELVRSQGNFTLRGGGAGFPIEGEQRQTLLLSGKYAWAMQGNNANPQPAAADERQLSVILTPHGFLKAALAANPTAMPRMVRGDDEVTGGCCRSVTVVSFTALGKYRINGVINGKNEVENVQTWIPNPVLGDMVYEIEFNDYKDFGGVKFPTNFHEHHGDNRLNNGHNSMDITITDVKANVPVAALTVPDNVRQAAIPPVRVEAEQLAPGVWRMAGGSHHSIAVEFQDYVAVIEAPLNEERSLAVIAEIGRRIPNKPIRYVINTHHHFDHSGGVRTYVAQGAWLITHAANHEFFETVALSPAPRTLEPDLFSKFPRLGPWRPFIIDVGTSYRPEEGGTYVLSDGKRSVELYHVPGLNHNNGMLVAYFRNEKILVTADIWSPLAPGRQPPTANQNSVTLYNTIKRLKLDVDRIVGIHGGIDPMSHFESVVGPVAAQQRAGGGN